mmetsp:Transcript_11268/g.35983  ORF Transcript_11268/g.35983 Transcript_11268/m.35983 type:complete len:351 (+) Transcript_11268:45-1097(+)
MLASPSSLPSWSSFSSFPAARSALSFSICFSFLFRLRMRLARAAGSDSASAPAVDPALTPDTGTAVAAAACLLSASVSSSPSCCFFLAWRRRWLRDGLAAGGAPGADAAAPTGAPAGARATRLASVLSVVPRLARSISARRPLPRGGRYLAVDAFASSAAAAAALTLDGVMPCSSASRCRCLDCGASGSSPAGAGRQPACSSTSSPCWCSSAPLKAKILNPLSTFMRGARVAAMKNREQGDQDHEMAHEAVVVPMIFILFRSQKSICPAKLPKPAMARNRPCGDHEMTLRGRAPNSNTALPDASNSVAAGGMRPAMAAKSCPVGPHAKSCTGPSLDSLTGMLTDPSACSR